MLRLSRVAILIAFVAVGCTSGDRDESDSSDAPAVVDSQALRAEAEEAIEAGTAGEWTFGGELGVGTPVTIASLNDDPASYAGKIVKIEGTVSTVCKAMGCWVEVTDADGAKIMASSAEHNVLVPRNSEGRKITVEGHFTATEPEEPGGEATYSLSLDAASVSDAS